MAHLRRHGCEVLREGSSHTVVVNRAAKAPRHREINDFLARKICRDLQVPEPKQGLQLAAALFWGRCVASPRS